MVTFIMSLDLSSCARRSRGEQSPERSSPTATAHPETTGRVSGRWGVVSRLLGLLRHVLTQDGHDRIELRPGRDQSTLLGQSEDPAIDAGSPLELAHGDSPLDSQAAPRPALRVQGRTVGTTTPPVGRFRAGWDFAIGHTLIIPPSRCGRGVTKLLSWGRRAGRLGFPARRPHEGEVMDYGSPARRASGARERDSHSHPSDRTLAYACETHFLQRDRARGVT